MQKAGHGGMQLAQNMHSFKRGKRQSLAKAYAAPLVYALAFTFSLAFVHAELLLLKAGLSSNVACCRVENRTGCMHKAVQVKVCAYSVSSSLSQLKSKLTVVVDEPMPLLHTDTGCSSTSVLLSLSIAYAVYSVGPWHVTHSASPL